MKRRYIAAFLALLVFDWCLRTDVDAQIMRFWMSTTSAIAQASGTVASGLANQLAYYASNGTTVQGLAITNNAVVVTSNTGVPSESTTLPASLTIPAPTLSNSGTNVPTSSTATCATNSAQIASTQFVKNCEVIFPPVSWLPTANPSGGLMVIHAPVALTLTSLWCRVDVGGDTLATLDVYMAASGTGGTGGTKLNTTSCNLNPATLHNDVQIFSGSVTIPAGNSVYVVTTGTVALSGGGVAGNFTIQ